MATQDNLLNGAVLAFKSAAVPDDTAWLMAARGRERISHLYEVDLLLGRLKPYSESQIKDLLKAPCAVALGDGAGEVIHGLLASIELLDGSSTGPVQYEARLVPNVWLLTMARTNRLFQKLTVPAMVEQILSLYGLTKGTDFEIAAWSKSPEREYIVQYAESDWDFIQRWLEHEGYFYFFEHGDKGEKLVILHQSSACPPIPGQAVLPFRDRNNLGSARDTISRWQVKQRRLPARVMVNDYNYRRPSARIVGKADADKADGFGSVLLYGEHVKDDPEALAIATVRAERIACEKTVIRASTDCPRLRVGHTFELENHFQAELDGHYLVTGIDFEAQDGRFQASFEAISKKTPFRPECATPWPRIHGVMHGHVDSDSSGAYAQIDELGRYRVKLPLDGGNAAGSRASRWIRMAQHYSGAGYGSHFPLHKGAEVIIVHVDGNPDRPIIVASVPNPSTLTPSTAQNATQSVIQTASGIRIEMEDLQK
jgi:type VI secretion system secreted protein VgrG